jgi:hypothetical protein
MLNTIFVLFYLSSVSLFLNYPVTNINKVEKMLVEKMLGGWNGKNHFPILVEQLRAREIFRPFWSISEE